MLIRRARIIESESLPGLLKPGEVREIAWVAEAGEEGTGSIPCGRICVTLASLRHLHLVVDMVRTCLLFVRSFSVLPACLTMRKECLGGARDVLKPSP